MKHWLEEITNDFRSVVSGLTAALLIDCRTTGEALVRSDNE